VFCGSKKVKNPDLNYDGHPLGFDWWAPLVMTNKYTAGSNYNNAPEASKLK